MRRVSLIAMLLAACDSGPPTPNARVTHLKHSDGLRLDFETFYAGLKQLEVKGTRIERDGRDAVIRSSRENCDKFEWDLMATVPTGTELSCKDGSATVWLMERN